jgi:hypothetical protein
LLIEHGANAKAATKQGVTAMMAAAGLGWRYGDSEVPEADALAAVRPVHRTGSRSERHR